MVFRNPKKKISEGFKKKALEELKDMGNIALITGHNEIAILKVYLLITSKKEGRKFS